MYFNGFEAVMEKTVDFKDKLKQDKVWVNASKIRHLPGVIQKEYELLRENIGRDDIWGAIFRLKDIYETCMKIPVIMGIIVLNSAVEKNDGFTEASREQLQQEKEHQLSGKNHAKFLGEDISKDSKLLTEFQNIMSRMLKKPLSSGTWFELLKSVHRCIKEFHFNDYLEELLEKTVALQKITPLKHPIGEDRYENVSNWRNKVIGHGTLLIDHDIYWIQAYELVCGLQYYFRENGTGTSLDVLYQHIYFEKEGAVFLNVEGKRYENSAYVCEMDGEEFFFDSYFNDQKSVEITNYLSDIRQIKGNTYFPSRYAKCFSDTTNSSRKSKKKISNSQEREMLACLNRTKCYEKPVFLLDEIRDFTDQHSKGILYLQMEQGMGKSALAHYVDGRYHKNILQKDLDAVVRVYHIRDTLLRAENRVTDFYTALDNNLKNYNRGRQLEVDEEEYEMTDGRNLRQEIRKSGKAGGIAFAEYLELFRCRYEEELEASQDDLKLIYIIDGIDELNSDTKEILNCLPTNEQLQQLDDVDHIYIILLSRLKTEESLTPIAIDCIHKCEKISAGQTVIVDGNNKQYNALLKRYIKANFPGVTEQRCREIVDRAQHKFLYVAPYIAMGNIIFESYEKITTAMVAENYIRELFRRYWGVSKNTLYLILAAVTVFDGIRLEEICHQILFRDLSYDVIGCMNDLMPLLTVKRTDGADRYELANTEFKKVACGFCQQAMKEVIIRFRMSLNSWYKNADRTADSYKRQWSFYVEKLFLADQYAECLAMESDEEYVKTVLDMEIYRPQTLYADWIEDSLNIHVLNLVSSMHFASQKYMNEREMHWIGMNLQDLRIWKSSEKDELLVCRRQFINELIQHYIKCQEIDEWFYSLVLSKTSLRGEYINLYCFEQIAVEWHDKKLIDYLTESVEADLKEEKANTYAVYLEILLEHLEDVDLQEQVLRCLLKVYRMYMEIHEKDSFHLLFEENRKKKMLRVLERARRKGVFQTDELTFIGEKLEKNYAFHMALSALQECEKCMVNMEPEEVLTELAPVVLKRYQLEFEENDVVQSYPEICQQIATKLLVQIESFDENQQYERVHEILCNQTLVSLLRMYGKAEKDDFTKWLFQYCMDAGRLKDRQNIQGLRQLQFAFYTVVDHYDRQMKEHPTDIGMLSGVGTEYVGEEFSKNETLEKWEKCYILYCGWCECSFISYNTDEIEYGLYRGIIRLLQELFAKDDMDAYDALNREIEHTCQKYHFTALDLDGKTLMTESLYYIYWLTIRYERSLNGKDARSSQELYEVLKEEYAIRWNHLKRDMQQLSMEPDAFTNYNRMDGNTRSLFVLTQLVPDSIVQLEALKENYMDRMNLIRERLGNNRSICTWIDTQIQRLK